MEFNQPLVRICISPDPDIVFSGRVQDVHLLRGPDVPESDRLSEGAGGAQAKVTQPPAAEAERKRRRPPRA